MEEDLNQNIVSSTEPVMVTSMPPSNQPPFGSWWKAGGLFLGAVILAGGIFFAGYQYSQKQVKSTVPPTTSPTPTLQPTPTSSSATTITQPSKGPVKVPTTTPVEIPSNWLTFKEEEYGFEIKFPPRVDPKRTKGYCNHPDSRLSGAAFPFWEKNNGVNSVISICVIPNPTGGSRRLAYQSIYLHAPDVIGEINTGRYQALKVKESENNFSYLIEEGKRVYQLMFSSTFSGEEIKALLYSFTVQ